MYKKSKNIDIIFLSILTLNSAWCIYMNVTANVVLSVNNYLGFGFLAVVILLTILRVPKHEYLVLLLLVLSSFNMISYSFKIFSMSSGYNYEDVEFHRLGIVPIAFISLVIYVFVEWDFIKNLFGNNNN